MVIRKCLFSTMPAMRHPRYKTGTCVLLAACSRIVTSTQNVSSATDHGENLAACPAGPINTDQMILGSISSSISTVKISWLTCFPGSPTATTPQGARGSSVVLLINVYAFGIVSLGRSCKTPQPSPLQSSLASSMEMRRPSDLPSIAASSDWSTSRGIILATCDSLPRPRTCFTLAGKAACDSLSIDTRGSLSVYHADAESKARTTAERNKGGFLLVAGLGASELSPECIGGGCTACCVGCSGTRRGSLQPGQLIFLPRYLLGALIPLPQPGHSTRIGITLPPKKYEVDISRFFSQTTEIKVRREVQTPTPRLSLDSSQGNSMTLFSPHNLLSLRFLRRCISCYLSVAGVFSFISPLLVSSSRFAPTAGNGSCVRRTVCPERPQR